VDLSFCSVLLLNTPRALPARELGACISPAIRNHVDPMNDSYSLHGILACPDTLAEVVGLGWPPYRDRADTAIGMAGRFMGKHFP
jgi:hypothetical protein